MATPSTSDGKSSGFPLWAENLPVELVVILILAVLALRRWMSIAIATLSPPRFETDGTECFGGRDPRATFPGAGGNGDRRLHVGNPTQAFPRGVWWEPMKFASMCSAWLRAPRNHRQFTVDLVPLELTLLTVALGKIILRLRRETASLRLLHQIRRIFLKHDAGPNRRDQFDWRRKSLWVM